MDSDPVLQEKVAAQKRLDAEAKQDLRRYYENLARGVRRVEKKYGVTFRHAYRQGGGVQSPEAGLQVAGN
jgi:hypothetical protein